MRLKTIKFYKDSKEGESTSGCDKEGLYGKLLFELNLEKQVHLSGGNGEGGNPGRGSRGGEPRKHQVFWGSSQDSCLAGSC